jgi:polysaccharide export outer membrane protein
MRTSTSFRRAASAVALAWVGAWLAACSNDPQPGAETLPAYGQDYEYVIGPGDGLSIFVWRNPELSRGVTVRPDGKLSVPLVEDLVAAGKTSTQLAREIEEVLGTYIKEPLVTVIVGGFSGVYDTQVRVLGEATSPTALPYRDQMTMLDVMIAVGGLTEFADGNKAQLVRVIDGEQHQARVRLEDLIKDGDISANVPVAPGDVIIIPEAWF